MARVAPVLHSQIKDGKIDLTAIVNTHQYVSIYAYIQLLVRTRTTNYRGSHWDHAGGNDGIVRI